MTESGPPPVRRIRITDFYTAKRQHERWAMLTSYDQYTAELFDEAGVWALLVGDPQPTMSTPTRPRCRSLWRSSCHWCAPW